MLEAVLWERACSVRKGRQWKTVVDEMISNFDKTWPTILCTIDQAATGQFDARGAHQTLPTASIKEDSRRRSALKGTQSDRSDAALRAPTGYSTLELLQAGGKHDH